MPNIPHPVFSLSCPGLNKMEETIKEGGSLIIEEDTVYELDKECMECKNRQNRKENTVRQK